MLREIPLLGEMSRSDKRVAVFARKRWHFALRNDGGGRRCRFYQPILNTVGADPCVRPLNTANISITFVGACIARPRKRNPRLPVLRFYRDKRTYNSAHKKRLELNAVFLSGGRTRGSAPTVVKKKQRCRKRLPPPSFRKAKCHLPRNNVSGEALKYIILFYFIKFKISAITLLRHLSLRISCLQPRYSTNLISAPLAFSLS